MGKTEIHVSSKSSLYQDVHERLQLVAGTTFLGLLPFSEKRDAPVPPNGSRPSRDMDTGEVL